MTPIDPTSPDAPLDSFLYSFSDEGYRRQVGTLGMLRLLEPTRAALQTYERTLVAAARREGKSWEEIGHALGVPKQTAHRRWHHVG